MRHWKFLLSRQTTGNKHITWHLILLILAAVTTLASYILSPVLLIIILNHY